MSIEERTAALGLGGGGQLGMGFGANATATPYSTAPSNGPAKLGEVETEAVVSGFKPSYTASEEPAPASEEEAPKGTVLSVGWLKKTGKGLKAKVFEGCFVTLRSDPLLAFHTDETQSTEKGFPLDLTGGTVKREEDMVVVGTPAEAVVGVSAKRINVLKLQAETPEEAEAWVAKIDAALAGAPQPS